MLISVFTKLILIISSLFALISSIVYRIVISLWYPWLYMFPIAGESIKHICFKHCAYLKIYKHLFSRFVLWLSTIWEKTHIELTDALNDFGPVEQSNTRVISTWSSTCSTCQKKGVYANSSFEKHLQNMQKESETEYFKSKNENNEESKQTNKEECNKLDVWTVS